VKPRASRIWMCPLVLLAAAAANATPVFYDVNLTIGAGAVTGFMETDGTIGTLTPSNFLDWSLKITDGVDTPDTLTGANSAITILGTAQSATSSTILFNFSTPPNSYFFFERSSGPADFVCFGPGGAGGFQATCANGIAGNVESLSLNGTNLSTGALSGSQAIATPEPAAVILIGSGLLAFAFLRQRSR
jgi:hypothetical protein